MQPSISERFNTRRCRPPPCSRSSTHFKHPSGQAASPLDVGLRHTQQPPGEIEVQDLCVGEMGIQAGRLEAHKHGLAETSRAGHAASPCRPGISPGVRDPSVSWRWAAWEVKRQRIRCESQLFHSPIPQELGEAMNGRILIQGTGSRMFQGRRKPKLSRFPREAWGVAECGPPGPGGYRDLR